MSKSQSANEHKHILKLTAAELKTPTPSPSKTEGPARIPPNAPKPVRRRHYEWPISPLPWPLTQSMALSRRPDALAHSAATRDMFLCSTNAGNASKQNKAVSQNTIEQREMFLIELRSDVKVSEPGLKS